MVFWKEKPLNVLIEIVATIFVEFVIHKVLNRAGKKEQ